MTALTQMSNSDLASRIVSEYRSLCDSQMFVMSLTQPALAGTTLSGRTEIARYHAIKEVEITWNGAEYATFACGMDAMSFDRDIAGLVFSADDVSAPMCKRCARKLA